MFLRGVCVLSDSECLRDHILVTREKEQWNIHQRRTQEDLDSPIYFAVGSAVFAVLGVGLAIYGIEALVLLKPNDQLPTFLGINMSPILIVCLLGGIAGIVALLSYTIKLFVSRS